ncbi:MurR/RpiR family transcriptional regulator [Carnobacteriaceae bacterium zg-ZUI252]|nr:MurR/RpiR family transcriptional regulator [Carnobacteriaceae bacterium zg-ZUI252]MBS4769571.1 MurR/RpiR family transcriptional regulator [Carnobacteriaceae bacterium zg-ZUI240]QTU83036.1 MurR/RpiR family transcriptional regulator [Carnobacteriaceae bacterium zg-C25]
MEKTLEELVLQHYEKLNDTDKQIWQKIYQNAPNVMSSSIDEVAGLCNVSRTTLSRFVRKIGLDGFSELKVRLRMEKKTILCDDATTIYEDACDTIIQYVQEQRGKNYTSICELLFNAHRIVVYGSGDIQNSVAKHMKRLFSSAQEMVYDIGGSTFDGALLDVIDDDDVVILISLSGNNDQMISVAKQLKLRGVKLISLTEFKNNALSALCEESLYISSTNFNLMKRHPHYKVTMFYYVLIELLFINYSLYKTKQLNQK